MNSFMRKVFEDLIFHLLTNHSKRQAARDNDEHKSKSKTFQARRQGQDEGSSEDKDKDGSEDKDKEGSREKDKDNNQTK